MASSESVLSNLGYDTRNTVSGEIALSACARGISTAIMAEIMKPDNKGSFYDSNQDYAKEKLTQDYSGVIGSELPFIVSATYKLGLMIGESWLLKEGYCNYE